MKAISFFTAATAVLGLLVSCQKEKGEIFNTGDELVPVTLTASLDVVRSKVTYNEVDKDYNYQLKPVWEGGVDKIIGFDEASPRNNYTFTVTDVDATTGEATLEGNAPANCNMHLIYLYGAAATSISDGSLVVDYTDQTGDKTMPAVMLADGTITDGTGSFTFHNAGAVIGIKAVKGVPKDSKVTKITVSGENLSAATIALSGSALALTATEKADDSISVDGLDLTVSDANGTLSTPVFIAVPAGAKIAKVSVLVTKEPETMKKPSTAADKEGIDYVTIAGKKWAKWNVGANSEKDYGWYFAWGDTNGYVYKNSKCVSASGIDTYSYSPSSAYTANASAYVYVKTQSFTGHRFDWADAPFNNGSFDYDATYFSSVRSTVCPSDILAKKYDAAAVNWGGSWRMPTNEEFKAMKDATYWAWDATDMGYYVFDPDASHTAGTWTSSIPAGLNKSNALLFFPAAGYGGQASLDAGSRGYYWLSTLNSSNPYDAYFLYFDSSTVILKSNGNRNFAQSVRPLSE